MYASVNYTEFDVTPHLTSSATVDKHGKVTDVSISIYPFGDHNQRIAAGNYMQGNPVMMLLSLEEAEILARLLNGALTDARNGQFDEIDRD